MFVTGPSDVEEESFCKYIFWETIFAFYITIPIWCTFFIIYVYLYLFISISAPMAERRPIYNSGVKRQDGEDVDHVFLRFGKRG